MRSWPVIGAYAVGLAIGYLIRVDDPVVAALVAIMPALTLAFIVWAFTPRHLRGRRPGGTPPYITRP